MVTSNLAFHKFVIIQLCKQPVMLDVYITSYSMSQECTLYSLGIDKFYIKLINARLHLSCFYKPLNEKPKLKTRIFI